ncbi:hypothetical protein XBFFL1_1850003 [Xenorhabdus bovienii str. feltiae Florida]|nr:hypothetical protein XBFFR1_2610003 [Xenorhabdus bovienii str. feltiae France]CDG91823.1 hypothetical protein XBFFL1_1850003 [Xenorhabdus bovienii str. feltiae Florida]
MSELSRARDRMLPDISKKIDELVDWRIKHIQIAIRYVGRVYSC